MAEIDFDEIVSLRIADRPSRNVTLADAVREIIAMPQKVLGGQSIVRRRRRRMDRYEQVVALYERSDFPD